MTETIKQLYDRYEHGLLDRGALADFKERLDHASDEELWQLINGDSMMAPMVSMPEQAKHELLNQLRKIIYRHRLMRILRYAAMIVVLVSAVYGASYFFIHDQAKVTDTEISIASGHKGHIVLPDGTRVDINSNTVLRYNIEPGDHRWVTIERGEAYFDVTKDPACPFVVSVRDMDIKVLGTTFNVRLIADRIETSLFTGRVSIDTKKSHIKATLQPGEKSVYHDDLHMLSIEPCDAHKDQGWRDGYLIFTSTPLSDVLRQVEAWYGVHIHYRPSSLTSDRLTGSFHNESIRSVMQTLSLQYGFRYDIVGEHITIK